MARKVFISYRRDDSAGHAGRVHDRLQREFDHNVLFIDVDAIPLGANFVNVVREEVAKCDVLLAIIGRGWLNALDELGNHRLDQPGDFVRVEIAAALQRDIPVIPILLDGTRLPKAEQLPDELRGLTLRNGLDVRHSSFHPDMDKLIRFLRGILSKESAPGAQNKPGMADINANSAGLGGTVKRPKGRSLQKTIACVDDERHILTSVRIGLEAEGYRVRTFDDGASALEALIEEPADLTIVDYNMPRMKGTEFLRRLRRQWDMPAIFLSSREADNEDFLGGPLADDYITKPFSQRMLVARVRAVLGRVQPNDPAAVLECGKLKLEPQRHTCHWDSHAVVLTVTEFLILQALATRPGVVKTRDALMDAADYDDHVYVDERTIDAHIKSLRKRFKRVDDSFDAIETLYGVGYRFRG